MELRLAEKKDLPNLKKMYDEIIKNMYNNNVGIWNEFYPYEVFSDDIERKNLYLLVVDEEIIAAFTLYASNEAQKDLVWKNNNENAMYISRVGVNTNYLRQGIGGLVIEKAIEIAKQKGKKHLRLLVVDINKPAINLYLKNGFKQVDGIHEEIIGDNITLIEYGFEIEV